MRSRKMSSRWSAFSAALALLALAAPAYAAFPGQNGKIAFQDAVDIRVVDSDGTGNTALTNESGPYNNTPEWSPDGLRIVFEHVDDNLERDFIEVMNADGSGRTFIADFASSPSWSPDGRRIAFARSGDIWTIAYPADGSLPVRLTNTPAVIERLPEWSPDGSRIAFGTNRDGDYEIYTMSASDGTGFIRLTNDPADDSWPEWSPDGSRIVFSSNRDGNYEIYTMSATDGTAVTRLTSDPLTDTTPAWSPQGDKIVWERFFPERLWVMNADGSAQQNLGVEGAAPDWQPLPGPTRSDYKNAARFCKADRELLGEDAFRQKYGGGANAQGKCVSGI